MKEKYLRAVSKIRQRFEYARQMGASDRSMQENEEVLEVLEKYLQFTDKDIESLTDQLIETQLTLSALLEKFYRRGVMLQLHGYSQAALNWIDGANTDFLDSELQLRAAAGYQMQATFLDFINIETSYRVIELFAQIDLKEIQLVRSFKAQGSDQIVKNLMSDMEPYLVKYIESPQIPTLAELIKYHAFNSARYGKQQG